MDWGGSRLRPKRFLRCPRKRRLLRSAERRKEKRCARFHSEELSPASTGAFSGTWDISRGTGLYAGIHGTGTWYEDDSAQPGIVVFPCEGQVHFD